MSDSHASSDSLSYRGDMDEDTIELMLSPEQMSVLSRAAAATEAEPAAPPPEPEITPVQVSAAPEPPAPATPRAARLAPRHWPAGGVAAIVGVTVVLGTLAALGAIAQRSSERKPVAAAVPAPVVSTPVVATQPPPPATPGEPVRFKNPFDHSEVFEFPPGTSQAEARQAVADVLMERARDRHVQIADRKHRSATARVAPGSVGPELVQNAVRPR